MRALLPSVWLLLACLYSVSLLAVIKPFSAVDDWPAPKPVNETVRAKQPHPEAAPTAAAEAAAPSFQLVSLAAPVAAEAKPKDEWAQIAGYTTMAFAEPTPASSVLSAYAAGRPLRVISREHGFARVQDLGSGQFGWVKEAALAPFTGGYRQREQPVVAPQLVASVAPVEAEAVEAVPAAPQAAIPQAMPAKVVLAAKRIKPPRSPVPAVTADSATADTATAAAEPGQRGFFGLRRTQPQRVALRGNESGFAGMISRALGGR
jgi:hypothetical protein